MQSHLENLRKTKIICTIGPASSSEIMILRLAKAGMDCARLNFSHGTYPEHSRIINLVRRVSKIIGRQTSVIQDLPGPKIRIGKLKDGSVLIKKNSTVVLTSKDDAHGSEERIPITYPNLAKYVPSGASIFLSDGSIRLKVIRINGDEIICRSEIGGELFSGKGVNIPQLGHDFETFTEADKRHLEFGLKHDVDLVAISFVRKASDIEKVRKFIGSKGGPSIISKIEKKDAVDNIEHIIPVSDAIMVARGDLGVENPIEQVPIIQKSVIAMCKRFSKPVITATQMLESMVSSSSPTRAEVTDVANAIFDGTDAVMLSEETAMGKYPVECVKVLGRVSVVAEKNMLHNLRDHSESYTSADIGPGSALSEASFQLSQKLNATLVVSPSNHEASASKISKFRPKAPIIALAESEKAVRKMGLIWGVHPVKIRKTRNLTEMLDTSVKTLVEKNLVRSGERLMIVCDDVELSRRRGELLFVVETGSKK